MNKTFWHVIVFCVVTSFVHATPTEGFNYPGGIALLPVPCHSVVRYHKHRVLVKQVRHGQCVALVGIPLSARTGVDDIRIYHNHMISTQSFNIRAKQYPSTQITIRKKGYATISHSNQQRIAREQKKAVDVFQTWTPKLYTNLHFRLPAKGRYSCPFGFMRTFNQKMISQHKGVDIAVPKGTAVHAPAAGYVLSAHQHFLGGKVVVINHGMGLITAYCHLSKIVAKTGEYVKKGQIIAYSGATGRVTGPHLHWEAHLNTVPIDPLLLTKLTLE